MRWLEIILGHSAILVSIFGATKSKVQIAEANFYRWETRKNSDSFV